MADADRAPRRRRHPRVTAHLPVRLSTIDAETDPWTGRPFFRSCREWSANLSREGLFVRTREPILPGRRVLVELDLPDVGTVEAVGRVAWARRVVDPLADRGAAPAESGIGLQLLGAEGEDLDRLEAFVRRFAGREQAA